MRLIDATTATDYLRDAGRIAPNAKVRVETLSGGVSNVVLRIEPDNSPAFILKQSRERLRTKAPWFSRLDRIWRETAVLGVLQPLLPPHAVPRIEFEDRENFLFAMEAADPAHVVWKEELLAGRVVLDVAARLGEYLASIHSLTHGRPDVEREFDCREIFVQLRVDPFYRRVAEVHADLRPTLETMIDEMWATRVCLVLGDFSPKNVLVGGWMSDGAAGAVIPNGQALAPDGTALTRLEQPRHRPALSQGTGRGSQIMLIDFETGHFGDPAFDLGFFLSHLLLKGIRAGDNVGAFVRLMDVFWERYLAGIASKGGVDGFDSPGLTRRAIANLAGCALARVDGTSPVGYLSEAWQGDAVRRLCGRLLLDRVERLETVFALLETAARPPAGPTPPASFPSH